MLRRNNPTLQSAPPESGLSGVRVAFQREVREILIIKPSSMGDVVHTLPAVGVIRRRFPHAHISWLVKPEWASLLQGHPFIDEVLSVPFRWRNLLGLFQTVRRRPFDLVVDFQGLFRSAVLGYLTWAPVRVGFADGREKSHWFYTDVVPTRPGVIHAIERYLALAEAVGGDIREFSFSIRPTGDAAAVVDLFLKEAGLSERASFAIIHPSSRWESKRWNSDRFAELGDWLVGEKNLPVVFIGGPGDEEEIDRLINRMKRPAVNGAGRLNLIELAELIRRASIFISNDSGPMHLAAAVGTPVIALFGPTDPEKVGPYGAGHVVIQKEIECSGCGRNRCVQQNRCMNAIEIGDVQRAIDQGSRSAPNKKKGAV